MPLADIMHGIEEYRFSSELNLAAGTKAFQRAVREHHLVRKLTDLAKDADACAAVATRIEELSQAKIDPRYENRFDAALSAYLTVLGERAQPETVAKAASAAAKAANCWWTVGISRELLMHAVATGAAQPAVPNIHTAAVSTAALQREVLSEKLLQPFKQTPASVRDNVTSRILSGLEDVWHTHAQTHFASNLLAMPPAIEDGNSFLRRAYSRGRMSRHKGAGRAHGRAGRQFARA